MIEASYIGNCLIDSGLMGTSLLLPEHFHDKSYRDLWKHMLEGHTETLELSKLTTNEAALHTALDSVQLSTHRLVEEKILTAYNVRIFEVEMKKALESVRHGANPADALQSIRIEASDVETEYSPIANVAIEVYADMQARVDGDGSSRFIATGLKDLDGMIGGIERGNLTTIAARASQGKTSIGMDMAIHIAKTEQVCFNSIEMDRLSIGFRVTSTVSGLNLMALRVENEFPADVWRKAAAATMTMNDLNLNVNDNSNMTVPHIIAQARRHKKEHGLALLLIDYLGLIKSDSIKKRHQEIGDMTRELKGAAKELDCAVVLLAQLNREADGQKPTLANLAESSSIENDSDLILFPYRPNKGKGIIEDALLIVGKNRNGPIGDIPLKFLSKCASFKNNDYKGEK